MSGGFDWCEGLISGVSLMIRTFATTNHLMFLCEESSVISQTSVTIMT